MNMSTGGLGLCISHQTSNFGEDVAECYGSAIALQQVDVRGVTSESDIIGG
jgi:hypothetical protein